ncbi:MAG: antitermination protein NusG [Planctomycetaceae bacterium]|nr:MAG: antitermination protein NusG [Planctomycetaceae bacterium]
MPILSSEPDCFPENLLEQPAGDYQWWACYTRSRQEKQLMRLLRQDQIAHYAPVISRRYRSPAGRIRESFLPLFSNYVFVRGDEMARYHAVCSGCVSNSLAVVDTAQLVEDLARIQQLVRTGAPLSPEARIESGDWVRVRTGRFAGFEGTVIRRHQKTLLIVEVRFMNQGASVALDDCQFDLLKKADPEPE